MTHIFWLEQLSNISIAKLKNSVKWKHVKSFLSFFFCQMTVRQKGRWLLSFDRRNSRIEWETTIVIMWHGSPSHPRLSLKPRGERDQIGLSSFRKSTQKGNPKSHFSWLEENFHEISMFVFTQIFSRDLNSWRFFKWSDRNDRMNGQKQQGRYRLDTVSSVSTTFRGKTRKVEYSFEGTKVFAMLRNQM